MEAAGAEPNYRPHGKLDAALNGELARLERARPEPEAELDPVEASRPIGVWVRFTGDLGAAIQAGFHVGVVAGQQATGTIAVGDLARVADAEGVIAITAVQQYHEHLNNSVPAIHADHASVAAAGGGTGTNVIVGIIDTGIDVFHHNFRNPADGSTRILTLLDLTLRQTISMPGGPTGGSFTLSWQGPASAPITAVTTAAIAFNAAAGAVQAALTGLAGGVITAADVTVAGGPLPGTPVTIDFTGQYAGQEVTKLWATSSLTGGGAPAITITRGREFSSDDINAALNDPAQTFLSTDTVGHGTHVAGIAAGNGLQAGVTESGLCHGSGTFVGVAPEASLVIVKRPGKTNDDDDPIVRGATYIFAQPGSQAAVVNISLGGAMGAHDGTSSEELALDALLVNQQDGISPIAGRAIVVSAGNEGGLTDPSNPDGDLDVGRHASKPVAANSQATFSFVTRANDTTGVSIDLWYEGAARLAFALTPPAGFTPDPAGALQPPANAAVSPATRALVLACTTAGQPAASAATAFSYVQQPPTTWPPHSDPRDKHEIILSLLPPPPVNPPPPGTTPPPLPIAAGTWTVTVTEIAGAPTTADAWMTMTHEQVRKRQQPMFSPADQVRPRTLTIPATAANVITVGNFDYRDNTLAPSSSRGPTTDTSAFSIIKPDLCGPGVDIASAKSAARNTGSWCDCCYDFYVDMTGTSMSAPHVTGLVALIFGKNNTLGYDDVRRALTEGCQPPDPVTAPMLPDADWGAGIVDGEQTLAHVVGLPQAALPHTATGQAVAPPGANAAQPPASPGTMPHLAGLPVYAPSLHRLSAMVSRAGTNPTGALVAALVSTHFIEVRRLVNTNRRILVVWHRMGGPRLLREAQNFAEGRPVQIPAAASGRPISEWLDRILDLLHEYGSPALRADVTRYRPLVFELASALLPGEDEQPGEERAG
jgi:subtilisin family serine protease